MKIFIDTNIFLGFYEANTDHIDKILDLSGIKDYLITIDYCWNEYLRNRPRVFNFLINEIKAHQPTDPHRTSFISGFEEYKKAKEYTEKTKESVKDLIEKVNKVKFDTKQDIVFSKLLELYEDKEIIKFEVNFNLIERAKTRKILGNPPMTKDSYAIGDELIWETLLENVKDDLIIVSRDKTFSIHLDFLKNEYQKKIKKDLYIFDKLKDAFDKVGASVPTDLSEFEAKIDKPIVGSERRIIRQVTFDGLAVPINPDITYCRFCGNMINTMDSYCQYCGNVLWPE